jgi:hypothetical protein
LFFVAIFDVILLVDLEEYGVCWLIFGNIYGWFMTAHSLAWCLERPTQSLENYNAGKTGTGLDLSGKKRDISVDI